MDYLSVPGWWLPSGLALAFLWAGVAAGDVSVTVDTGADVRRISPWVYGSNGQGGDEEANAAIMRLGGNRTTGLNWETGYSNAGNDWRHSSDDFMLRGIPREQWRAPGIVFTRFHEHARSLGAASLLTLQMAGYVAADNRGTVPEEEAAPSARWLPVKFSKAEPASERPDTADGVVYLDEFVHFLVRKYGRADEGGVAVYSLDNEPALWPSTHPRICPQPITCDELIERSVALAGAVKDVDPTAQVIGPAVYGWTAMRRPTGDPQSTGWAAYGPQYDNWFLDFYLDRMRQAEEQQGRRLLDMLDVHWYPEVRPGGVRITTDGHATDPALMAARVQAPRSLWENIYREDSWIGHNEGPIRLLPRLQESIDRYYPGTKLCITEFSYGGAGDASGAVALADFLGICARHGVHMTNHWGGLHGYKLSAYQIYRNYDGRKSTFGDTLVRCTTDDVESSSAYAALDDDGRLHLVLISKELQAPLTFRVAVAHGADLTRAEVYAVDASGPAVRRLADAEGIVGNTFTFTAAPLSVNHLVLSCAQ